MLRIRHCGTALSASLCVQAHALSYMSEAESAGRRHKALQTERFLFINLCAEFACSKRYYTSTYNERRRNARSSGDEKGSAEHQNLYAVAGALCFFCTKATSGIMRRRRLMCESRVCPCPQGFAEWQMGETREEGGHMLDMFALGNL